jgi:hypothetical protein
MVIKSFILLFVLADAAHASDTVNLRHSVVSRQLEPLTLSFESDVTPDVIFGDGNGNGAFTVGKSVDKKTNIEIGKLCSCW